MPVGILNPETMSTVFVPSMKAFTIAPSPAPWFHRDPDLQATFLLHVQSCANTLRQLEIRNIGTSGMIRQIFSTSNVEQVESEHRFSWQQS